MAADTSGAYPHGVTIPQQPSFLAEAKWCWLTAAAWFHVLVELAEPM